MSESSEKHKYYYYLDMRDVSDLAGTVGFAMARFAHPTWGYCTRNLLDAIDPTLEQEFPASNGRTVSEIYDALEHETSLGKGRKWSTFEPWLGAHGRHTPGKPGKVLASAVGLACHGWVCNMTFCARRHGPGKRRKCGSRRRGRAPWPHQDVGTTVTILFLQKLTIVRLG